ncbi:hypothetical protein QAD02_016156 [Eretmocerus hayati]|uniref:Uncharacterized protein n=1 Tax=Eretmocerus hayati TaxID=131215 RepID=A0ACC2PAQ0_9HYME|nr:hypothetical protein QAD02_016156 [Eretmocerus hayati]
MKRLIDEFPASIHDIKSWSSQEKNNYSLRNEDIVRMQSEEKFLKIGFVDLQNHQNVTEELVSLLDFIEEFNPIVRGHHLILLFNFGEDSLENFLRFAWSKGFLDLTVVSWAKNSYNKILASDENSSNCKSLVHLFNPFLNEYSISVLEKETNFMPNKLKKLNGYQLSTQFSGHLMHVMANEWYRGPEFWNMLFGFDVSITKALAEAMNFSAVPQFVIGDRGGIFKRFNVTNTNRVVKNVDFIINLDQYLPNDYVIGNNIRFFKESTFEQALFSEPLTNHLIIKQYSVSKTQLSPDVFLAIVIFFIIASIYFVTSHFLSFDRQKWTFNGIIKALIRGPVTHHRKSRCAETIIVLSMCAVSSILFVYISNGQLNILLYNEQYLNLKTLQDVADSGIVIAMSEIMKAEMISSTTTALKTIINLSESVNDGDYFFKCWDSFLYRNDGIPYGCMVNNMIGKVMVEKYSDKKNGWILSMVEEPIQMAWPVMKMKFSSQYKNMFEKFDQRFFETGLVEYWSRMSQKDFISLTKKLGPNNNLFPEMSTNSNKVLDKSKLQIFHTLACIFVSGCILSSIVLFYEKIFSYLMTRKCSLNDNVQETEIKSSAFIVLTTILEARGISGPRFNFRARKIHALENV